VFALISAVEGAGIRRLAKGQSIFYEVKADRRTGKESATNRQQAWALESPPLRDPTDRP
jgi:CspA family cold shock protein